MSYAPVVRRQRAVRSDAGPILKWAGGKTRILGQLGPLLPASFGRYFEPFVGGGALFFELQPEVSQLSDLNEELINVYRVVRDDVEALIDSLGRHRYEKDYYYRMRASDTAGLDPVGRASRTVYLNRTCFNGLYRVNRSGQFNVPMGRYSNPDFCPSARLRASSEALVGCDLLVADFAEAVEDVRAGDLVYFDPPYDPISRTANFTAYTANSFGDEAQTRLAEVFADLDRRGALVVLSNSDTPLIRSLYADYRLDVVRAPRAISRDGAGRQPVDELVVRNF